MTQEAEPPIQIGEPLPFNPEDYSLEEILRPQGSALMVIDVQNDFLDPKGFFGARLKHPTRQMRSIVPHIQGLIDQAHTAGVPVIFTQGYEDVRLRNDGPGRRRAVAWKEQDGDGSVNSQSGTWGSELYGVKPQDGDILVKKHLWSAFDGKDEEGNTLKEILDKLGVRTLVVTGVTAETCVETSIRDAYNQGYFVVVAENSVGSDVAGQLKARMAYWKAGFVGDAVDESVIQQAWTTPPPPPASA